MSFRVFLTLAAFGSFVSPALADVTLPAVFGDHMVLQRSQPIPVWGRAAPGENVVVRLAGQKRETKADDAGRWRVVLAPLDSSAEPRELTIAAENTIVLRDVLVGEVWLCSGQSNMEMAVGVPAAGAQAESSYDPTLARALPALAYPTLRLFRVSQKSREVGDVRSDGWAICEGAALAHFSAAGFFFARDLQAALGVPIGLIEATWGGSRLEEWLSDAAYAPLETILGPDAERCFERNESVVSRNYDVMIAPLAPFALRGVLWYQGEANLIFYNDGLHYADKFAALVANWRAAWSAPELPFYSVQIAPFTYTQFKGKLSHADDALPKLWEAQQRSTAIPHTGLVPIADTVADVHNIHPGGKSIVGRRLAALALARTYGRADVAAGGPVFREVEFEGAIARVVFAGVDGDVTTNDGAPPNGFEIAGADGAFYPATASIRDHTIEVTAPEVARPAAVRFGWHETARPNLVNRAGWPAFAFRSNGPAWTPPK
jgi:sialate O-acetylesterase